ncbi:MAG: DUF5996 family protein [Gammaproteobacteria bacterium]|nr:DUF5996 family protein [Gammaproteobacteria bacterium]MDJ0870968.1 DUF5996 family protein [Gammaproteobacteria bacterium]MDJ0891371.1 DUF5996 family protein [Gammaproteobacteria bacterium]
MSNLFPPLTLHDWRATRDTLHGYARLIGKQRTLLMPPQKHWWHVTLHAAAVGLTTTPMPVEGKTLEILLDLTQHRLCLITSLGEMVAIPLQGQSPRRMFEAFESGLAKLGVSSGVDREIFKDDTPGEYDPRAAARFWSVLSRVDAVFKRFKGTLREETGPVHVFPHHFDLSMHWFSGRLVPGVDPADEESADEHLHFGFVTGDEIIPESYFYAMAYPQPEGFTEQTLPDGAVWHTTGFSGAVMMYETLVAAPDAEQRLLEFLQAAQRAGSTLMR